MLNNTLLILIAISRSKVYILFNQGLNLAGEAIFQRSFFFRDFENKTQRTKQATKLDVRVPN